MKDSNFLNQYNAKNLWHPMTSPIDSRDNPPKIIVEGEGVHIIDVEGNKLIDGVGGLWNVNLGYSCENVKKAISQQLDKLPYYSIFRGTSNDLAIELSYELEKFFEKDGMKKVFYTSGGSDSVETALRLARQYHKLKGESGRTKFISLKKGYHGTHTGGASVNGNANFRSAYEPLLSGCFHITAPYTYRNPFNETDPEKLAKLCVSELEDEIKFQGKETIAAMIMEPIIGAGGVIPAHKSFAPMVEKICKENGILLINDEVITAYGRTGEWSGARLWGTKPDIMCTAKAITNGYFPFGAVMLGEKMAEVFEDNQNAKIGHGYTYSGHPVGAAAALACLKETTKLNVTKNAKERGTQIFNLCNKLKEKYKCIGDVRGGHGLMTALELVNDRKTKETINPDDIAKVQEEAYKHGTMIRVSGPNIILSPPLIINEEQINDIVNAIECGLKKI